MMPSGTPNGGPNGPPSYLRTNSLLGQSGSVPTQPSSFPSLVSPRIQFGNNNTALLGNMSNPSSLLNNSFGNGSPGLNASHMNLQHGGGGGGGGVSPMDMVSSADPNPLLQQQFANPGANQMSTSDHRQSQQVEPAQNNFQRQFSIPHNQQHQQQQQQLRGSGGSVKTDPQMGSSDQIGPHQQLAMLRPQHQLSSLNNNSSSSMGPVKLEPQQLPTMRNLGSFKLESHQHSDTSLFLQQQQQQQLLQLSRQNSQGGGVHMNRLQQQRILQIQQQQQQQQQLLKSSPQQRVQLQQQQQQQQLQQGGQVKTSVYEPGTCARRLTHYMYHQQHRPADNNIEFWRKFVSEYFAPHAKKRWCVSLYGSGRQTSGVFPQDVWHCEICNRKPGRGFETTVEVLPRLCKIKYDSGTQEELLYVDMPREYQNASGQIVLDYAKAIQESVFDQLRVVRDGQLRIVFNSDLKICSWEFCARRHEELVPRRLIVPQVTQLVGVAQKYQAATQNPTSTSNLSSQDLHTTCNSFVASARQLAKMLEVPLVNDLGYTKRYVRCLQISEVVNSMIDLIDYSRETGTGPMASLVNFPRSSTSSSGLHLQIPQQQLEKQKTMAQATNHNIDQSHHGSAHTSGLTNNGVSMNPTSTTTSPSTMSGHLLHQNSMISRQDNSSGHMNGNSYGGGGSGNVGNTVQIPSASSSSSPLSQPQPNNGPNPPSPSQNVDMSKMQQAAAAAATTQSTNEADMNDDPQSSVQQIIQEMMMSSQLNGVGSIGNDIKGVNGMTSYGNLGSGGVGGTVGGGGIRAGMNNGRGGGGNGINQMGHDTTTMTTTMSHQQQQNLGNHRGLSNGLGRMNSFNNNLHFDWKTTQ